MGRSKKKEPETLFSSTEMQMLCASPLFRGISRLELLRLWRRLDLECLAFADGDVVVEENADSRVLGIVLSGNLHVYDSAFKGARHLVRIVRPGGILGASLIAERRRGYPALVTAFGACRVAVFSLEALRKLLRRGNAILFDNVSCVVSEELQASWRKIAILSCAKIEERVMLYLQSRVELERSKTIAIGSTEAEFADYLGVHRTALARVLRKLAKEGLFTYRRDVFMLA